MNFSQVKNLTIPEGSVILITDSNGEILYGKTEYRELEYIHFSGAEYIQTGWGTKQGYPKEIIFSAVINPEADQFIYGCYDGSVAAAGRRYYARVNASNSLSTAIGAQWNSPTANTLLTNVKYTLRSRCYTTSSQYYKEDLLYQTSDMSLSYSTTISNGANTAPTTKKLTLGCNNSNQLELFLTGNIYHVKEFNGGGTSANTFDYDNTTPSADYVPAQRKSDGVCGLYNILNNVFWPLQGTNITDTAAGPTVNENPLWARIVYSNTGGSGYWISSGHGYPWTHEETIINNVPGGAHVLLQITAKITTSGATDCYGAIGVDGTSVKRISGTSTTTATYTINQVLTMPSSGSHYLFTAETGHTGYNSSGAYSRIQVQYASNSIKLLGGGNTVSVQTSAGISQMYDIKITVL